jgi:hypothetical protein
MNGNQNGAPRAPASLAKRALLVIIEPADAKQRFAAIDATLARHQDLSPVSILFEGALPSLWQPGNNAGVAGQAGARAPAVHNLGFGCPCCIGSLPLTVTMTRVLRQEKPELIILAPLPGAHLESLGRFLSEKFSSHLQTAAN